jgi:hypothetical protein
LEEMKEGAEVSISPKVAAAKTTGVGRSDRAATAAILISPESSRGERGE